MNCAKHLRVFRAIYNSITVIVPDIKQLQSFFLLDIKEILVSIYRKLAARLFVARDNGAVVHLKRRAGPFLADRAFDRRCESSSLVVAADENENLFGIRHGADAYGKSLRGNLLGIISKETGIDDSRIRRKVADARS